MKDNHLLEYLKENIDEWSNSTKTIIFIICISAI